MKHHKYTAEQDKWLADTINDFQSWSEQAEEFNHTFGATVTYQALATRARDGKIPKRWISKTRFAVGSRPRELPIGTVRHATNGTYIKVANTLKGFSGYKKPDWLPLQEKVWCDANGPLKNGEMVCFLDCNRSNFSLDNLTPITRKVSVRMSQNGWWSEFPDITKTGIKWCEHYYAIHDKTEE